MDLFSFLRKLKLAGLPSSPKRKSKRRGWDVAGNPALSERLEERQLLSVTPTVVASFDSSVNGSTPVFGLIADPSGNLYGTTGNGGPAGAGTVFEVPLGATSIKVLASFDGMSADGGGPDGLALAGGLLYGVAYNGGQALAGTIFSVPVGGGGPNILAQLDGQAAALPSGRLIVNGAGDVFGTAQSNNNTAADAGAYYELPSGASAITQLATFDGPNGAIPEIGLIADAAGNYYGTTLDGGDQSQNNGQGFGTVFKIPAGSSSIVTLANFEGANGETPYYGGLTVDASGNLFGETADGGDLTLNSGAGDGTLYEIKAGSSSITTLVKFNDANGSTPQSGLVMDPAGNLYGTTSSGGTLSFVGGDPWGTVFELPAGTSSIVTVAQFNGSSNGAQSPQGNLYLDGSGNLFGTTTTGGANNKGTVFELSASNPTVTITDSSNGAPIEDDLPETVIATVHLPDGTPEESGTLQFTLDGSPIGPVFALGASGPGITAPGIVQFATNLSDGLHQLSATLKKGATLVEAAPLAQQAYSVATTNHATISPEMSISLFNPTSTPEPYNKPVMLTIMNPNSSAVTYTVKIIQSGLAGGGDALVNGSSMTQITIPAKSPATVSVIPTALSLKMDDVHVVVFDSDNGLNATASLTFVSVIIPDDIYALDTPVEMIAPSLASLIEGFGFYRIPPMPGAAVTENVMVQAPEDLTPGSIVLTVSGQDSTNGTVNLDGNPTESISVTKDIHLQGLTQTAVGAKPGQYGGQLKLAVQLGGTTVSGFQSNGFSVAAIPENVHLSTTPLDNTANLSGFQSEFTVDSDSTVSADLAQPDGQPVPPLELQAQIAATGSPTLLRRIPVHPSGGFLTVIPPLNIILKAPHAGLLKIESALTFNDPRTGATRATIPNSGFVFSQLYYLTTPTYGVVVSAIEGAATSPGGFTTDAGSGSGNAIQVYLVDASETGALSKGLPPANLASPSTNDAALRSEPRSLSAQSVTPLVVGAAAQLAVTTQPPATIPAGSPFGLVVQAEDSSGNLVSSYNGTVTLRLNRYTGSPTGTLAGNLSVAAVNGVATFSGLSMATSGGYSLTATATGLIAQTSNSFNVTALPAVKLVVVGPLSNVLTATPFEIEVAALDAGGNIDASFNGSVTLSLSTNPAGASFGGTLTGTAVNGVATFSDLTLSSPGSGYVINASGDNFNAASSAFDANNDQLAISTQPPASVGTGKAFALTVSAQNSSGAVDTSYSGTISLALDPDYAAPGTALMGLTSVQAVNGVATFSGLTMTDPGQYVITATGTNAKSTSSQIVYITTTATKLVITTPPPDELTAGAPFEVAVTAEDASGNVDTSFSGNVTLAIDANAGGGALGGTTTVAAVNGVATFAGVTLNGPGDGYSLIVSANGLSSATTDALSVAPPGTATQLVFTTEPAPMLNAGATLHAIVKAEDGFGTVDTSFTDTVTISDPDGTLTGTVSVDAVGGVASFNNVQIDVAGAHMLVADDAGVIEGTSSAITVNAGKATTLVFAGPAQQVLAGGTFGLDVAAIDSFGNLDPTYTGAITVALMSNPGGSALGGARVINAIAGDASFTGLTLNNASSGYTLVATGAGLASATSPAFDVTLDQLVVTAPLPGAIPAQSSQSVTVTAENAAGVVDSSFTGAVTVALGDAGGDTATLGGTLTVNAVAGVATFSGLTVDNTGIFDLLFTATGVGQTVSDTFTVTPSAATTTTLTMSSTTPKFDDSLTFTATVTSNGAPVGGGTITLLNQGAAFATVPVQSDGTAVYVAYASNSGGFSFTASFAQNNNLLASTSPVVAVTVGPQSTAIPNLDRFSFPAVAVTGQPLKTSLPVIIHNGGANLKGTFTIVLYIATDVALDENFTEIGRVVRPLTLKSGGSTMAPFHIRALPASLPAGTYYFLAQVIDPMGDADVESSNALTVQAPIITLSAVGGAVKPAVVKPHHAGSATVTVTDTGNIDVAGTLVIVLIATSDGATPAAAITFGGMRRSVHLRHGRSMAIRVPFNAVTPLPAGAYKVNFDVSIGHVITSTIGGSFTA